MSALRSHPRARAPSQLRIVGQAECVDFPDWGVRGLHARVDTGAQSSAVHVENVTELGGGRVRFDVRLRADDPKARVTVEAKIARRTKVRASTGQQDARIFVKAHVRLGGVEHQIEVGLVDRRHMTYRMLLGRSALERRFLVDVSRRYALGRAEAVRTRTRKP